MSTLWLLCIDDTDNAESVGTGKLARWLAAHLAEEGLVEEAGVSVTRHQLLVHPDVPYTSHNSAACIQARSDQGAAALLQAGRAYLERNFHEGANPGLCVLRADAVPAGLVALGRTAQREVLALAAFDDAVRGMELALWCAGETGQGRIGACAGAALRSTGNDGRFIGLRGIRDLKGRVAVEEILARSAVDEVRTDDGRVLAGPVPIETRDWVRPSLLGGRAVLVVREDAGDWVPFEKRSADD